jgi:hypothetical protein
MKKPPVSKVAVLCASAAFALASWSLAGASCRARDREPSRPGVTRATAAEAAGDAAPPSGATAFAADAGAGYVGRISLEISSPRLARPATVAFFVEGDRVGFDSPNRALSDSSLTIIDVAARRLVLLPEGAQVYVPVDLAADADGGLAPTMTLRRTGKKDVVAGRACEIWQSVGQGKARSEACVTEGIAFVDYGLMANLRAPVPGWLRAMTGGKLFPLRAIEVDERGTETLRAVVTTMFDRLLPEGGLRVPAERHELRQALPGSPLKPGRPI